MTNKSLLVHTLLVPLMLSYNNVTAMYVAQAFRYVTDEKKPALHVAFSHAVSELKSPRRQTMDNDENTATPSCKACLCKCPCLLCIGCDKCMGNIHLKAISENRKTDEVFSCCVVCCVTCGCIGYCRTPCRCCAACAETSEGEKNWRWLNDSERFWEWYQKNCCTCPTTGTMPRE